MKRSKTLRPVAVSLAMLRTPVIKITADNKPLDSQIMNRLISLTVTDNKAMEADELSIVLNDHDSKLELPKRGVKLQCWLGFSDIGTHDMGIFSVDTVEWSGTPDTITIKAKSADMTGAIKTTRSQSYHQKTLGSIASEVANRHSLKLSIKPELANIQLGHVDQTDESDLHLLTRLCYHYGAAFNIKHGQLLIFIANQNQTISGLSLNLTTITRQTGDQFRFSVEERESDYTGVTASYQDQTKATKATITAKNPKPIAKSTINVGQIEQAGSGDDPDTKTKRLKGVFKDKAAADAAANAEMKRITENQAKFSLTTAYAYPALTIESPIKLQGFKSEIDVLHWTVDKATHSYSKSSGLSTQLDLVASLK